MYVRIQDACCVVGSHLALARITTHQKTTGHPAHHCIWWCVTAVKMSVLMLRRPEDVKFDPDGHYKADQFRAIVTRYDERSGRSQDPHLAVKTSGLRALDADPKFAVSLAATVGCFLHVPELHSLLAVVKPQDTVSELADVLQRAFGQSLKETQPVRGFRPCVAFPFIVMQVDCTELATIFGRPQTAAGPTRILQFVDHILVGFHAALSVSGKTQMLQKMGLRSQAKSFIFNRFDSVQTTAYVHCSCKFIFLTRPRMQSGWNDAARARHCGYGRFMRAFADSA